MSLVSFWIFVLVDMSTYLSPILTIMPPRIEGSDWRGDNRLQMTLKYITLLLSVRLVLITFTSHQLQRCVCLWGHGLTLYLCFQLDSFTLLEEAVKSYFQLTETGCIQRLKWIHMHIFVVKKMQFIPFKRLIGDISCLIQQQYISCLSLHSIPEQ